MDDCVSVAGTVLAGSQISVDVIWPAGAAIELGMSAYFEMGWVGLAWSALSGSVVGIARGKWWRATG